MHNIKTNFDKIFEVVKAIIKGETDTGGNYRRRGTKPRFSDMEVIALSLTAECLSIDSEHYLFAKLNKEYRNDFKKLSAADNIMIAGNYCLKRLNGYES